MTLVNWPAVIVAAISTFLVGGLWYSPVLFGKAWMKVNGFTDEDVKKFSKARTYGVSFIFSLIMSANLAMFLATPETDIAWGAMAGFLAGFGWVALSIGVIGLFENRSWKYIFINGGYQVVAFVVMGVILGAWRN